MSYLWCDYCGQDVIEDSFSAAQRRGKGNGARFCLKHSVGDQRNYIAR
jgi:hypothetical protein